jgi:hypothetical protein
MSQPNNKLLIKGIEMEVNRSQSEIQIQIKINSL